MVELANGVLLLHAGLILFVVFGPFAVLIGAALRRPYAYARNWRIAHLLLMAFITAQTALGMVCPLTILENWLRDSAGQTPYSDAGLIADLLHRLLFFDVPLSTFALIYAGFLGLVVATFWLVPIRDGREVKQAHQRQ